MLILDAVDRLARRARLAVEDAGSPPSSDTADPLERLGVTAREREVLALVAEGRSNGQITDALFISRKTPRVHVSNLLAKLNVASRVEAAALARAIVTSAVRWVGK